MVGTEVNECRFGGKPSRKERAPAVPFKLGEPLLVGRAARVCEVVLVCIVLAPVQDPDHISVECFPRLHFIRMDRRPLKLDHQSTRGLNIRDMSFARMRIRQYNLLPTVRKAVLPASVPFSFRLPPAIAVST